MQAKSHWEGVYTTTAPDEVSWFQEHSEVSLGLIGRMNLSEDAQIIDVGGGASTLVDDLLLGGYRHLTVLDISTVALRAAQARLGTRASEVEWLEADINNVALPPQGYDVWHDRAVFHFLTRPADRARYIGAVRAAVKPGGHIVVATFGPDGPLRCSGLDVVRYSPERLHGEFGAAFELVEYARELHHTPWGAEQQFIYCCCRKP